MARINKWLNTFVVQEQVDGKWCDACEEETYKAARVTAKEYRDNGYGARAITRRVLNPEFKA
jgi:hypothetical protein